MKVTDNNALRAAARAVMKQIEQRWQEAGVTGKSTSAAQKVRDQIAREELDAAERKLLPRFTKVQLVYTIGIVTGRIEER